MSPFKEKIYHQNLLLFPLWNFDLNITPGMGKPESFLQSLQYQNSGRNQSREE
jgi:hypothetical protein